MVIDPDVRAIAEQFRVDPSLIQAVMQAEGNIVKAVQCSFPSVTTREAAIEITCRSAVHAMSDYIKIQNKEGFIQFWAKRWAPVGATNDPNNLNANWSSNVSRLWA